MDILSLRVSFSSKLNWNLVFFDEIIYILDTYPISQKQNKRIKCTMETRFSPGLFKASIAWNLVFARNEVILDAYMKCGHWVCKKSALECFDDVF